jgi:hypothetical protein
MKTNKCFPALPLLLVFCILLQKNAISQTANNLIVHEWGTFTTLASSKGELLNGLYLDEEELPDFVHQSRDLPSKLENTGRFIRNKGIYFEPLHVNVKMETPVIYFYSPQALQASVRVDFPNGFIGQWFPENFKGQIIESSEVDFLKPVNGFMEWKVNVLSRNTDEKITHEKSSHT